MKAALDARGADSKLFHQGAATGATDPDVIVAAMAKSGVELKRPVWSDGPFGEHAQLPKNLGRGSAEEAHGQASGQGEEILCQPKNPTQHHSGFKWAQRDAVRNPRILAALPRH